MVDIERYTQNVFEEIKHVDENANEFWYARELQVALGYSEWRNFYNVIEKAKEACKSVLNVEINDFVDVNKIVKAGAFSKTIKDIKLSRYACYLIVQNGDSAKGIIALGQTYFAVQTRKQELIEDEFEQLTEDERRLHLRYSVKGFNKKLADTAHNAGVTNYGRFQNAGYKGLYNGEGASDIKSRKGLKKNQDILDYMGATELAANYFRITQTEEKIRNEKIKGEEKATTTHYNVGNKVRKTMIEISGKAPEDLPTSKKSINQIESEKKKLEVEGQLRLL